MIRKSIDVDNPCDSGDCEDRHERAWARVLQERRLVKGGLIIKLKTAREFKVLEHSIRPTEIRLGVQTLIRCIR